MKVLSTEGGNPLAVDRAGAGNGIAWSPDGRHLFFARRGIGGKRSEVWRVPVDGGEPLKTDLSWSWRGLDFLRVHPDGRRIAYVAEAQEAKNELWVLENFLPGLDADK